MVVVIVKSVAIPVVEVIVVLLSVTGTNSIVISTDCNRGCKCIDGRRSNGGSNWP